ncbi:hypothetical protein FAIPA1_410045 [Frankia sp. AiPs1]
MGALALHPTVARDNLDYFRTEFNARHYMRIINHGTRILKYSQVNPGRFLRDSKVD